LRVLFNSFWVTFRKQWLLSHSTSSRDYSNSMIMHIVVISSSNSL
jgi:hypothetical protein